MLYGIVPSQSNKFYYLSYSNEYNFSYTHSYKNKENQVQFNEYLKQCRENNHLTIETTTVSKGERGAAKPHISRQVAIIKYFQKKTGTALPCWEDYTVDEAEEQICKAGMHNLIGKSKKFIYDFPSEMMRVDDMKIIKEFWSFEKVVLEIFFSLKRLPPSSCHTPCLLMVNMFAKYDIINASIYTLKDIHETVYINLSNACCI